MSRDPIGYEGSQWNLYEYVLSSPIIYSDPFGTDVYFQPVFGRGAEMERDATREFTRQLNQALTKICPCVDFEPDGELGNVRGVHGGRGVKLKASPIGEEDAYCQCVKAHSGGCSLLFDLFTRRQAVLIRQWDDEKGKYLGAFNRLNWNPTYLGQHPAGDSTTVLAHELVHAWLDGSSDLPKRRQVKRWIRMGEIYAVQGENQIATEIYGPSRGRRADYSGVPVPDKPLFAPVTNCCEMYKKW